MSSASHAGHRRSELPPNFAAIYRAVLAVPKGRVATYGQIGELAGFPRGARIAATALKLADGFGVAVPWHRVIGKRGAWGRISILDPIGAAIAKGLLEKEGVRFNQRDMIDLGLFGLAAQADAASKKKRPARPSPPTARNRPAARRR